MCYMLNLYVCGSVSNFERIPNEYAATIESKNVVAVGIKSKNLFNTIHIKNWNEQLQS